VASEPHEPRREADRQAERGPVQQRKDDNQPEITLQNGAHDRQDDRREQAGTERNDGEEPVAALRGLERLDRESERRMLGPGGCRDRFGLREGQFPGRVGLRLDRDPREALVAGDFVLAIRVRHADAASRAASLVHRRQPLRGSSCPQDMHYAGSRLRGKAPDPG
jgi:hypothetical protein